MSLCFKSNMENQSWKIGKNVLFVRKEYSISLNIFKCWNSFILPLNSVSHSIILFQYLEYILNKFTLNSEEKREKGDFGASRVSKGAQLKLASG